MLQILGVVFDWGGVIIDEPSAALHQFCTARLGLTPKEGGAAIVKHLPAYQEGRISENTLWQRVCAECGQSFREAGVSSLWREAVRQVFHFRDEVLQAIRDLSNCGVRVGFLSNTEPEAAAYFYERHLDHLFYTAVLSCEVGLSKPSPQIYQLTARRMEMPADRLLMLDDRPENIDGALRAGMQATRVCDTPQILHILTPLLSSSSGVSAR